MISKRKILHISVHNITFPVLNTGGEKVIAVSYLARRSDKRKLMQLQTL